MIIVKKKIYTLIYVLQIIILFVGTYHLITYQCILSYMGSGDGSLTAAVGIVNFLKVPFTYIFVFITLGHLNILFKTHNMKSEIVDK